MQSDERTIDDAIMQAVLSKHRSNAILTAYRLHEFDCLDQAWHIVNDIGDDSRFDQPDQDPSFVRVKHYLQGSEPWREKAKWIGLALAFILVGGIVVYFKLPSFWTGVNSYSWTQCKATIRHVEYRDVQKLRQQREETWHMRKYQYEYGNDAEIHRQTIGYVRYFPSLGDPEFHVGDQINILVDPDSPGRSIHIRGMYGRSVPVVIGLVIMLPGIVMAGFFAFEEWSYRSLGRHDPKLTASR